MNLREAAVALRRAANEAHQVASRIDDGTSSERLAISRDVEALAWSLERYADVADAIANRAGEPESWIAEAAPGELTEVFGR